MSSPSEGVPGGIELSPGVYAAGDALRWQFSRSGGPGGQNVNKVNTKAELWVSVSELRGVGYRAAARLRAAAGSRLTARDEIHLVSEAERSQEGNRAAVMERLRAMLIAAGREPKVRRKTKPTKGSRQRRLDSKKRRGDLKSKRRGEE